MSTPWPIGQIHSYHAHVYYDPATSRDAAEAVRVQIGERFSVQMGRWHDVGWWSMELQPKPPTPPALPQTPVAARFLAEWTSALEAGMSLLR